MVGSARRADRTPQRGVPTRIRRPNFVAAQLGKAHLAIDMKTLNFQIVPLATEVANAARRAAEAGGTDHAVITADSPNGFPCRHCLRWAQSGERVILFPYAAIPPGHPYSETGPIFVHEQPCEHYAATGEYPSGFLGCRGLRAYNSEYDVLDSKPVSGGQPDPVMEALLQNP